MTFDELIQKIKTPSEPVERARAYGKGSKEYDDIKQNEIEAFFANSYTTQNLREARLNKYKCPTGYIYLDFDGFDSEQDARKFREEEIVKYPFIAACWLSLSKKGLSALVSVKHCDHFKFQTYWDKLNEIFDDTLDPQTRSYYKLCCIPYDDSVYVNENSLYFDDEYDFSFLGLRFRGPEFDISEEEFQGKPYIVYPEGKRVWEINLFYYRQLKKGQLIFKHIKQGNRNKTIGYMSIILIHLNQKADKFLLLNTLQSINRKYCDPPLPQGEVTMIFEDNFKKYKEGRLDINKYAKKKRQHVFFNKAVRLTRSERMKIIVNEANKLKGSTSGDTLNQIMSAIKKLMDGKRITQPRIAEKIGKEVITIKRYYRDYPEIKEMVKAYNKTCKKGITNTYTSYVVGNNIVFNDTFLWPTVHLGT